MDNLYYEFGNSFWRTIEEGNEREWLLTNGLGGYANHTIIGGGNRMHHSYLTISKMPPVERISVFTRTQEIVKIGNREYDLTSQMYTTEHKNGQNYLQKFVFDGVPTFIYKIEDIEIKKTVSLEHGKDVCVVKYVVEGGTEDVQIRVVPLFTYKPHGTFISNDKLRFETEIKGDVLTLVPNEDKDTKIRFYKSEGEFYDRKNIPTNMTSPNFLIEENHFYLYERNNGKSGLDNHFTPYEVQVSVPKNTEKEFYFKVSTDELDSKDADMVIASYLKYQRDLIKKAGYNNPLCDKLVVSADNFVTYRKSTDLKTIMAGYPWFNDWGRDTMIALHGITLSTKRYEDAKAILECFAKYVKNGLLPNNFPEIDEEPHYNTIDGSLWYFYAVDMYVKHTNDFDFVENIIYPKFKEIINAYKNGTDYAIRMDSDGLIIAGDGSCQLTWMDAMIGDWVVTPRNGKPVEINALWYNALCVMAKFAEKFGDDSKVYTELATKVRKSFNDKFWCEETQCLFDVVDENINEIRCNQVWAVSLPYEILEKDKHKAVVSAVEKHLYNTYGLRSLAPTDEKFVKEYIGSWAKRDASYHMGTTWGYPVGAFITAYCKANDYSKKAVLKAKDMCEVFNFHLEDGCINGISEIFDGEFATKGKGCYNQAWSVSEVLRAYTEDVLPNL